jgi:hypothetical protein
MSLAHATASEDKASPFRTALAEWKRANADLSEGEAAVTERNERKSDKAMSEALEVLREAEWKLLRTPAANFVDVRERAMVVQDMFNKATLERANRQCAQAHAKRVGPRNPKPGRRSLKRGRLRPPSSLPPSSAFTVADAPHLPTNSMR